MSKKLLILSLSAGAGHVRAGEALREQHQILYPDDAVEHRDIIEFVKAPLKLVYKDFYTFVTKNAPLIWGYLYHTTNSTSARQKLHATSGMQAALARKLARYVAQFKPDEIICTHFVGAEIVIPIIRSLGLSLPVSVVVTDYEAHHLWTVEGAARYFVATGEVRAELLRMGIPDEKIAVSGIPISPAIMAAKPDQAHYERFALSQDRPVILVMSGGLGLQDTSSIVESLAQSALPLQIVVIAGRNQKLADDMRRLPIPPHITLRIIGFTSDIHALFAIAHMVITKAGGLTVTECVARGIPLLLTEPIPGQEAANTRYLLRHKAALRIKHTAEVLRKTHRMIRNAALRTELIQNMKRIARPRAAEDILKHIVDKK